MKLSDAMRLGAAIRPRQIMENLFDGEDGACAMGCVLTGLGMAETSTWDIELETVFPVLKDGACRECPECHAKNDGYWDFCNAHNVVVHLNNDHEWTIEEIANWLDTIDPEAISEKAAPEEVSAC